MPTTSRIDGTRSGATRNARFRVALPLVAALAIMTVTASCSSSSSSTGTTTSAQVSTSAPSVAPAGQGAPSLVTKADAAAVTLTMSGATMLPAAVSIPVGGTITLAVTDDAQHNVIVGTEAPLTVTKAAPKIFQFGSAGTFNIADISTHAESIVTVK